MNFGFLVNIFTTVTTFVQGFVEQVGPVVTKLMNSGSSRNANCEYPICGTGYGFCPTDQLSRACLENIEYQRSVARLPPVTTTATIKTTEDNVEEEKSSSSLSDSTLMLMFVGVVGVAIVGFLYIRLTRRASPDLDERKSSSWDV